MNKSADLMPRSSSEVMEMKSPTEESKRSRGRHPSAHLRGGNGVKPIARTHPPFRTQEDERASCEPAPPIDRYRFAVVFDDKGIGEKRKTLIPSPRRD